MSKRLNNFDQVHAMNQIELTLSTPAAEAIKAAAGSLAFAGWSQPGTKFLDSDDAVAALVELRAIEASLTGSWNSKRPIRSLLAKVEAFVYTLPEDEEPIAEEVAEPEAEEADGVVVETNEQGLEIKFTAREQWLQAATEIFRPWFEKRDFSYPDKLRVACSFTGHGVKGNAIGECWATICSKDSACEIMISPVLDDPSRVLDVLLHELIHAVLGIEEGHGKVFRALATDLGLTGKMTATIASPDLVEDLKPIIEQLGAYPHAALTAMVGPKKKQTTRLIKLVCPCEDCGYTVRTTAKWLEVGYPTCPCGEVMTAPGYDPTGGEDDDEDGGDDE